MATLRYAVGIPPASKEVTKLVKAAASRSGPGSFVISSGFRPLDSDSLHSLRLAVDVSVAQSTGDIDTLFDEMLNQSPAPDEAFYKTRLYDKGKSFTDAGLTADHLDHAHFGWDALPDASGITVNKELVTAGAGSKGTEGLFSFFFDQDGLLRVAAVTLGFGALAIGLVALMTDQTAQAVST